MEKLYFVKDSFYVLYICQKNSIKSDFYKLNIPIYYGVFLFWRIYKYK
jgi:hypothetical protein